MLLRGFEINIQCDGKPLEEYAVKVDEETNSVSCCIASEAGKKFEIHHAHVDLTYTTDDTDINYWIDGHEVIGKLCRRGHFGSRDGVPTSSESIRPFLFSDLIVNDDNEACSSDQDIDMLGQIQVTVQRCRVLEAINNPPDCFYLPAHLNEGPVHERSKKAGLHVVSLGDSTRHMIDWATVKYIDTANHPFAKFTFFYRPKEILQAQGICPIPETEDDHTQAAIPPRGRKRHASPAQEEPDHSQKRRNMDPQVEEEVKPSVDLLALHEEDAKSSHAALANTEHLLALTRQLSDVQEQLKTIQDQLARATAVAAASSQIVKTESQLRSLDLTRGEVIDLTLEDCS